MVSASHHRLVPLPGCSSGFCFTILPRTGGRQAIPSLLEFTAVQSILTSTSSASPLTKRERSLQGAEGTELSAGRSVGREDARVLQES